MSVELEALVAATKAATDLVAAVNVKKAALDSAVSTTQGHATTASSQAGIATTAAASASSSQGLAKTSETNAATSRNTAQTQAGVATTQAGISTTQAGVSTAQAALAVEKANAAAGSAAAAAASAATNRLPDPLLPGAMLRARSDATGYESRTAEQVRGDIGLADQLFTNASLRQAANRTLYGDGPYPTLDLQFVGATMLDPRIAYTNPAGGGRWNDRGIYEWVPANQPRFAYDPATGKAKGLLIEGAATNLNLHSQQLHNNAHWPGNGVASTTPATVLAPDGTQTASLLTSTGPGAYYISNRASVFVVGRTYTASVYYKPKDTSTPMRIGMHANQFGNTAYAQYDHTGGTVSHTGSAIGSTLERLSDGWFRLSVTAVCTQLTSTNYGMLIWPSVSSETPGNGFYIWGAQIEEGTFPTSYIPTGASQVTRALDSAARPLAGCFGANEGTIVFDAYMPGPRTAIGFALCMVGPGGAQEYIGLGYGATQANGVYIVSNGVSTQRSGGVSLNMRSKLALSWAGRDYAFFVNGQSSVNGTHDADMPKLEQLQFANRMGTFRSPAEFKSIQTFPRRLSDAQLLALTTLPA